VSEASVNLDELQRRPRPQGFALPRVAKCIDVLLPRAVGAMLLWAASLKIWDESGVTRVLEFDGVPQRLIPAMISAVIVVESSSGLLLILRPRWRGVVAAAVVLLTIYTAQLAYLAAFRAAPNCTCLGAWRAYRHAQFDHLMGIGRNACLILALLLAGVTRTSGTSPAST
jgi:hypothetical protein